ncbi:hypothetical protein [Microbacterium sp. PA5]|uniref:hypothetical protein n=1 Tax=Microbacterium sp. PA5 TaxID=3416654 RepID=UPI003CEC2CA3
MSRTLALAPPSDLRPGGAGASPAAGRVRTADRMSAQTRIAVLLQPLRVPPRREVVDRVRALFALGAAARAGRTFTGERWAYDPSTVDERAERAVRELPAACGTEAGLPRLREHADPSSPLTVFLGDDRIAVHVDHRIGDGFFAVMAVAALFADAPMPRVFTSAVDRDPLPAALASTFGRHPSRVARIVRDKIVTTPPPYRYGVAHVPAARGSLDLHTAAMSREAHHALAAWSRLRTPRVPPTVALLAAFRAALLAEGVAADDTGVVLVDLRRYLPSGRATLGNFVTGHPVDLARGVDLAGAALTRDLHAGRPLAALASARMPGRPAPREAPSVPSTAVPIVSDMGFLRALETLPWAGDGRPAAVAVSVDPASRNGITALTSVLRGRFGVSVSFDSTLFPAERVAAAAERLCADPLELLPR